MGQLGADTAEVDRLAGTFETTATRLVSAETTITALVKSVQWDGPDSVAFRGTWNGSMRAQIATVSERLHGLGKNLRIQSDQQRKASEAAGGTVTATPAPVPTPQQPPQGPGPLTPNDQRMLDEAARQWASGAGRLEVRKVATLSPQEQADWWNGLSPEQRAAIALSDPGALAGLEGLPPDVIATARAAYLDTVSDGIELSSTEDKIKAELDVWLVHLGAEGSAKVSQMADGSYQVEIGLDGEIGAKLGEKGAKGTVGIGGGVSQTYSFDSKEDAEKFVAGLYDEIIPHIGWSPSDVVDYLGSYSDNRTAFEGELRLQGEVELEVGAWEVKISGEAGARYDFDSKDTTVFVGSEISGEFALPSVAPVDGSGDTGSVSVSANVEASLTFDENGNVSAINFSGTVGAESSAGVEQFFGGTNALSKAPQQMTAAVNGGAEVSFNASLDMTDPIVQQRAAEIINQMGNGGVSLEQLQALMEESEVSMQVNVTNTASSGVDIAVASVEVSKTKSANAATFVKPPGGDITYVNPDEWDDGDSQ